MIVKTLSFAFVTFLLSSLGFAQSASDEKAVRAVVQKMEDAWNAHHYTYSGQYDIYNNDASMINPVGMYWINRAEIVKAHQAFGEMMFKYGSTKNQQVDVRFLAPTVALVTVKAQYRVEQDHNFPDGRKAGSRGDTSYSMLTGVLTKQHDDWKIASLQVTPIDAVAQAHDPIQRQASR
ncbi:MAG: hypothetical protein AVDCRST_MAG56-5303 [uncultured Cytophagales bacterium]|uniref:SnoaL-like domain-containing protein n=1 Tax=uncultured Cytophagales bacterium TaxID=158755 RepID=A0A6J4KA81_9SPHI|nr:MAG: hypothetical protein AVDCRST_MAG56-5303 [uncultured Cytophagales bacterium]